MNTEYGQIANLEQPTESLVCVCHIGEHPGHGTGFFPANENGFALSLSGEEKDNLPAWPTDQSEVFALCPDCGRLYSDAEIEKTLEARVAKRVPLSEEAHVLNLQAYRS